MPNAPRPWIVTPHRPIEKLEPNLWTVASHMPGRPAFPRRSTIAKLADGRLVFHDSFALDDAALAELKAWGNPAIQLVTNGGHRLEVHAVKQKLGLQTYCPAAADKKVRQAVHVDGHFDAFPRDPTVSLEPLDGVKTGEAVMIVKSGERTSLVFSDAIMNMQRVGGFPGVMFGLLGFGWGPKVAPIWKLIALRDKAALGRHFARLAALPGLARIVCCHGPVIDRQPAEVLRAAAARM